MLLDVWFAHQVGAAVSVWTVISWIQTKSVWLHALLVLLESNSFDHLTVDQICKEALLHRSSFYRYFNDKYDLLEQTLKTKVVQIVDNGDSEDDILKQFIIYINQHRNVVRHLAASDSHSSLYSEMLQILPSKSAQLIRLRHLPV